MGTKNNPGKYDCLDKALPDEPYFVFLARDPMFAHIVEQWAKGRREGIRCGFFPASDMAQVIEAEKIAAQGADWRRLNNGTWKFTYPVHVTSGYSEILKDTNFNGG